MSIFEFTFIRFDVSDLSSLITYSLFFRKISSVLVFKTRFASVCLTNSAQGPQSEARETVGIKRGKIVKKSLRFITFSGLME